MSNCRPADFVDLAVAQVMRSVMCAASLHMRRPAQLGHTPRALGAAQFLTNCATCRYEEER